MMTLFYNKIDLIQNRYDWAEDWFDEATLKHNSCDETLIPEIREYLENCVDILRSLHNEGLVETVEGLPDSTDIKGFDFFKLGYLITDLRQRYFPTEQVFDAA